MTLFDPRTYGPQPGDRIITVRRRPPGELQRPSSELGRPIGNWKGKGRVRRRRTHEKAREIAKYLNENIAAITLTY
jgi:hypothetical protein